MNLGRLRRSLAGLKPNGCGIKRGGYTYQFLRLLLVRTRTPIGDGRIRGVGFLNPKAIPTFGRKYAPNAENAVRF